MTLRHGNRLTLLETGEAFFPSLERAIESAVKEVQIETYIFADDSTGRRIAETLARAVGRGVTVRVIVDGYGSQNLAPTLREILEPAGVHCLIYRPVPKGISFYRHHLRRLHRKLAIIDGVVAYCGGINLKDDRNDEPGVMPRYDFAVKVEGPLVGEIHRAARRLWLLIELTARHHLPRARMKRIAHPPPLPTGQSASFVMRDNWRNRRRIEEAYVIAIQQARHEIIIANAYFLPGRRIRHALISASKRGVKVRLLLQGRPDHLLVYYATHALYDSLIEAGIELFEYTAAHLHAKVALVDSEWATVGSSNIDPFSLWLSREANVVFHDAALIAILRASLESAITLHAHPINHEFTRRQPWYGRVRAWAMYQLGRALIALTGFAARDEL
jgi:cardiolipin synthase A/B